MEDKFLLDTDFLVDFLRNEKSTVSFVAENEENCELCISIISLFELYYGAFKSQNPNKLVSVEMLERRMNVISISGDVAKEAGKIYANLEKQGKTVEFKDVLIGTTALIKGIALKTNNTKHFKRKLD